MLPNMVRTIVSATPFWWRFTCLYQVRLGMLQFCHKPLRIVFCACCAHLLLESVFPPSLPNKESEHSMRRQIQLSLGCATSHFYFFFYYCYFLGETCDFLMNWAKVFFVIHGLGIFFQLFLFIFFWSQIFVFFVTIKRKAEK